MSMNRVCQFFCSSLDLTIDLFDAFDLGNPKLVHGLQVKPGLCIAAEVARQAQSRVRNTSPGCTGRMPFLMLITVHSS
jgi:hypothetical protein